MKTAFVTVAVIIALIAVCYAKPERHENRPAVETKSAVAGGLTDIQSAKVNITNALAKLEVALDEAKALPASATKTALVDSIQAQKQAIQACRDLMQAIKKMNKDNSP